MRNWWWQGQIKLKESTLESSSNAFLEKEKDLLNKIEELEQRMEVLNQSSIQYENEVEKVGKICSWFLFFIRLGYTKNYRFNYVISAHHLLYISCHYLFHRSLTMFPPEMQIAVVANDRDPNLRLIEEERNGDEDSTSLNWYVALLISNYYFTDIYIKSA